MKYTSSTTEVPDAPAVPRHIAIIMDGNGRWATKRFLPRLFVTALDREVSKLHANNIRLKVVGDLSRFDDKLQGMIAAAERKTANNTRMTVTVCANYGGRWDIMQAIGKMVAAHPGAHDFSEEQLAPHLAMAYAPEPDLFIRTGGEQRISNFLMWQLAYTELFFTDTYWPDFSKESLDEAIASYQHRERRFGRTGAQLAEKTS